jgi:hypothetical protein
MKNKKYIETPDLTKSKAYRLRGFFWDNQHRYEEKLADEDGGARLLERMKYITKDALKEPVVVGMITPSQAERLKPVVREAIFRAVNEVLYELH